MQPNVRDIFGQGALYDDAVLELKIPSQAIGQSGLDFISDSEAVPILAAICTKAHSWLSQNLDESVKCSSSLTSSSPSNRNGEDRTEFTFTFSFYGNYQQPILDPDDLI